MICVYPSLFLEGGEKQYMEKFKAIIKKVPVSAWILLLILSVGVFLRTYHFHDWLRFSMDQSRDAFLISDVVNGKTAWPLLGPLAGGTGFHLGPAYYYFSIISAKIFGNYPDKMAYPSLVFSILAIPLFYFFLREYFSRKISLALVFLMSVSYFFIESSRFSSNPNLIPFFIILFLWSFLRFINSVKNPGWQWPIMAGVSLGIGVQLHTTLLVIMPIFTLLAGAYAIKKNGLKTIRFLSVMILCAVFLNVTQVIYEFKTDWNNTRQFMVGLEEKGNVENGRWNEIYTTVVCQAKANLYFVSSVPVTETCSKKIDYRLKYGSRDLYPAVENGNLRKSLFIADIFFIWLFFLSGYFLLGKKLLKETDTNKRNFLIIITAFNFVAFFFLIPIVYSLSVSYFNIIFFVPFVLLGLVWESLERKFGKGSAKIIWLSLMVIAIPSLLVNKNAAVYYAKGLDNNADNSNLKEIEDMSAYIIDNSSKQSAICFSGKKAYLERFSRPLEYMSYQAGKDFTTIDINDVSDKCLEKKLFYIQKGASGSVRRNKSAGGFMVEKGKKIGNMEIYILKNNFIDKKNNE